MQAQDKELCITIDDLPTVTYGIDEPVFVKEITIDLINTFNKYDIPAIGFVNEGKLYRDEELDSSQVQLLETWLKNGYDLGNHSYSHSNYHSVSFDEFTNDIIKGEKVTKALAEKYETDYSYFRHPYLRIGLRQSHADSFKIS